MATTFGRYTLVRKLATGGMAEVFLASADGPMGFQKKCVVKRILPHFSDDPQFVQMFLGEARLAAELNHPNLVQIFDFGEVDGQYFIAMEFIDGPNLRVLNHELRSISGSVPLAAAARMITMAAEGLQFAHDLKDEHGQPINLVHRDISPDNILVSRQGTVKVVDFGIAKAANQVHLTKSGMIKGKLAYMPPEQLAREPLDRRSDVYALGVVLYELVCGVMPFDATSEVSIIQAIMGTEPLVRASNKRNDLPPVLDSIISKCLEKDVTKRYQSCREFQMELERFIASTGEVVSVADVGKLVEHLFPEDHEVTLQNVLPPGGLQLDRTHPSSASQERTAPPVPTQAGTGMSATSLKSIDTGSHASKSRAPLFAGIGLGAIAIGVGAYLALKPPPPPPKVDPPLPPVRTPLPPVVAVVDAGAPEPIVDAGPTIVVAELDAGLPAVAELDAGVSAVAEVVDAGSKVVAPVAKMGRIDFRIRPVGRVYLDGKFLGETPLGKEIPATVGTHTVKVIEPGSNKTIEKSFTVKPGTNPFTHNFNLE
jgi:serine/threonine protein kinase